MHSKVRPQAKSLFHPLIPQRLNYEEIRGLVRNLIFFVPIQTDPDCLGRHLRYKDNYLFKERKIVSSLHLGLQSQPSIWSGWRSSNELAEGWFLLSALTSSRVMTLNASALHSLQIIPIYHREIFASRWALACEHFLPYSKVSIYGRN